MAKKKNNVDDDDLDFSDLDDLDFGDDDSPFGDESDSRKSSLGNVAGELGKEGAKSTIESLIKNTAKKALPEDYDNHYSDALEYTDFAKELIGKEKSKLEKSILGLGKQVQKILPVKLKIIDNYIDKLQDEYAARAEQNEEAMRETAIAGELNNIFDKQLEFQKTMAAKQAADDEIDKKERLVSSKLQTNVLTGIHQSVSEHTAFTTQISKEYYRKSLELQYKSYFIQADMLKTNKEFYKGFAEQFDRIVKNTGLPDFVKLNKAELIKESMKNGLTNRMFNNSFSNSEYVKGVKERIGSLVSSKVSDVTDKIESASDLLAQLNDAGDLGSSPAMLAASIAAGMGGGVLGEKLSGGASEKIKDRVQNDSRVKAGGAFLRSLGTNPAALFASLFEKSSKKLEEAELDDSPLGMVKRRLFSMTTGLLSTTKLTTENREIRDDSILNHRNPAIFDVKAHKSITEIIPLYLSGILKQNTDLAMMYRTVNDGRIIQIGGTRGNPKNKKVNLVGAESKELSFDFYDRKLATSDAIVKNIESNVLSEGSAKNRIKNVTSSLVGSTVSSMKK